MKKLTASLIALTLCAFMPMAQAWHTERFVREDGFQDCRIVLDEWDREPFEPRKISINSADETEKQTRHVEVITIEKQGSDTVIVDQTNNLKWQCVDGAVQTTCRRVTN